MIKEYYCEIVKVMVDNGHYDHRFYRFELSAERNAAQHFWKLMLNSGRVWHKEDGVWKFYKNRRSPGQEVDEKELSWVMLSSKDYVRQFA